MGPVQAVFLVSSLLPSFQRAGGLKKLPVLKDQTTLTGEWRALFDLIFVASLIIGWSKTLLSTLKGAQLTYIQPSVF
jgi:hypothetical protein